MNKKRVLIVEDDIDIANLEKDYLEINVQNLNKSTSSTLEYTILLLKTYVIQL